MARKPTNSTIDANELNHQIIAADIAEFRKRGGRIEVLGITPLRMKASPAASAQASKRKSPSPVDTKQANG
jgi:hypothetical protein